MADVVAAQENQRDLRVISVDPAPGKESTIFDGRDFSTKTGHGLRSYLDEPGNRTPETLLCWDAPLTGPADPASAGTGRDFTQRLIESFFMQSKAGFKTPKGISVRPYSGCPHWTITRSLLGLPRTGPYDLDFQQLPFRLLPAPPSEKADRPSVVEIHPAVAVWLWCKDIRRKASTWNYKGKRNDGIRKELWCIILERTGFPWGNRRTPTNDDEFDAAVGYLLGSMYFQRRGSTNGNPCVEILGDRCTGALLLPADPDLEKSWGKWRARATPRAAASPCC